MTAGRGAVVRAAEIRADPSGPGTSVKLLLDTGTDSPGLVRRMVDVEPGGTFTGTAGAAGELWFGVTGTARLDVDTEAGPQITPDRGFWIPPGASYRVEADREAAVRLDVVTLPAATQSPAGNRDDRGADPRILRTADLSDCEVETTGDRKFRVLFGPGHGCAVATQFVGEIPPGRAPEHSHPYDEVVLILAGEGTAHIGGTAHDLAPGTCLHLPPGLPHCLENTGTQTLRVLGVFHPADSPAAKT